MVEQINQSVDIVVPWMSNSHGNDSDDDIDQKIIDVSEYRTHGRPVYQITQRKYLPVIRRQLQLNHRILLSTYSTNAYYSCEQTEMKQKVVEHMTRTNAYRLMMKLNDTNRHHLDHVLQHIDQEIITKLNHLFHNQLITESQWQKMITNRMTNRFNSLYFLPDTRQENVPFHPMINNHHRLIMNITRFLTHLLQPLYNYVAYSTTFETAMNVIDAIERYSSSGFLQSNTLFAILYIRDLASIIPHEKMIQTLERFLHEFLTDQQQIESVHKSTIIDLVRLVLQNQYLLYENKLYQLIRGGTRNSPWTTLLTNIYVFYWQQDLLDKLKKKNEIFGRCFDEIFLTWNDSKENLDDLLHVMNQQCPYLEVTWSISNQIQFLGIQLSYYHDNDPLRTEVVHDLNIEPYSLPYVFGHPSKNYRTLLRATLIRAVRCYQNVLDFVNELFDIQLSFQQNGFSNTFINHKIISFLEEFHACQLKLGHGEQCYDQHLYHRLRQTVIQYQRRQVRQKLKRSLQAFKRQSKLLF